MAINMDSFRVAFNKLDVNLRDQLFEMINGDANKIIATITEQIRDRFSIREDYIENFVQEQLIQPLEYFQNSLADLIVEKTDIVTKVITQSMEKNGKNNIPIRMTVLMNEMARDFNGSNLEGIKNDFMNNLQSFLYRHGSTDFFNADLDESKVDEIRYEVGSFLTRLVEGYIENTKAAIQKNTTEYRESLTFEQKVELTAEDVKNKIFIGVMSDYRLKNVDGNFAFVDSATGNVIPITKVGNNTIRSLDGALEFTYGDKIWTFTENQNVMTLSDAFVALGTRDNPNSMRVEFGFDTATFVYNGEKTEDPEIITHICEEFRRRSPKIYERDFEKNPAIAQIEENARIQTQAKQEKISSNAAMFKTDSFPEKAAVDNASMFKTDADIRSESQEIVDEKTKQEIHERNEGAFNTDLPEVVGLSDDFVNLVAEIEETPDYVVTPEEESITAEKESDISLSEIDDRLFELAQDPKVQEYISLMKKAEELKNAQSLPSGILL